LAPPAAVCTRPNINRVAWRLTWAIADAGSYYFFYNAAENDWLVTSDSN